MDCATDTEAPLRTVSIVNPIKSISSITLNYGDNAFAKCVGKHYHFSPTNWQALKISVLQSNSIYTNKSLSV
ncbi:MAG: hypothetical protein LBV41_06080 [Cytophagaceae bacterium]|nr:hypothetical protein [Cytophagaceae bacterium]